MKISMTVAQFKADFSQILVGVQNGNDYEILFGRNKRPIAKLSSIKSPKSEKRILGTLENVGKFTEAGDGKITMEEFLGF